MLRDPLIIFVIAIVFIVDCGFTVESDDPKQDCKTLVEDKIDDLVKTFEYSEK